MYAAPALVARSDLIATLMAGVVAASGHANALHILVPPLDLGPVQFLLSWHRRNDAHPAQRWVREMIVSLCPGT
jgi:DNA-binding transcriptional LysR family regulator